jgi:hypothetical protein
MYQAFDMMGPLIDQKDFQRVLAEKDVTRKLNELDLMTTKSQTQSYQRLDVSSM